MKVEYESTKEVNIPKDPFDRIIGQDNAVAIARIIPFQRRHLLLVGPPGTGKSMIAQAIASVLTKPKYEISVIDNPENSERPVIEIRDESTINRDKNDDKIFGKIISPFEVPSFVAERLGLRCKRCGGYVEYSENMCKHCGAEKANQTNVFERYGPISRFGENGKARVATSRRTMDGREEFIIYERRNDGKIAMLTDKEFREMEAHKKQKKKEYHNSA